MSIFPVLSERDARGHWLKIAAAVWLLLTSIVAVINSVGLSRLAEHIEASTQDAQVQALSLRLAELEQQVADSEQPAPVSQADFANARQALDERIARIEAAPAADGITTDLQTLQARVGSIEARLEQARRAVAPAQRAPVPVQPAVPVPPFQVVGVELRGDERFLSIAPTDATTLGSVQLLREGDSTGGWHLQTIEAHAAVFRVDGQVQRLAVS